MRRYVFIFIAIVMSASCLTTAITIGGNVLITEAGMSQVNKLISEYNDANQADVAGLHLAWGGDMELGIGSLWGVTPVFGLRGLIASSTGQREEVHSSLLGVYAGGTFSIAGWKLFGDAGFYRGSFSFPAAMYEGLTGWGAGLSGGAGYSGRIGAIQVTVSIRLQWVPVRRLSDSEGGVYESRDGAFLDFSGAGLSIGASWSGF